MMFFLFCFGAALAYVNAEVIAFSAGKSTNGTYNQQETIKYDKIFANLGNGYDAASGIFTVPTAGLYSFQFHTLSHRGQSSWLELYHNNLYVASAYGHTVDDFANGGNNVVLKCGKGDTVDIRAVDSSFGYNTVLIGGADEVYSTFSGYMIAPVFEEIPTVG